ncbi:MAG: TonB-dependent receptor, partial [Bacteroidales bacterium]|nr:TonB-dependent receptor [Bacteroidales bacterium]
GTITGDEELESLLQNGDHESYDLAVKMNEAIAHGDIIEGEELIRSESFFDLGFKINHTIIVSKALKVQLNAGIQNIFNSTQHDHDRGMFRDAGFIYGPCQPRTIYFGIVIK